VARLSGKVVAASNLGQTMARLAVVGKISEAVLSQTDSASGMNVRCTCKKAC